MRRTCVVALSLIGLVTVASPASSLDGPRARTKMRLTSPAFASGGEIPDGFSCDGQNASVPLRWKGVPKKAQELALTMVDPDAPVDGGFVHWVVFGIDRGTASLPEQNVPADVVQGRNGAGRNTYIGPCPPPGDDAHHYRFTLYALSEPLTLTSEAGLAELKAAIRGKVLAKARVVGTYRRATDIA